MERYEPDDVSLRKIETYALEMFKASIHGELGELKHRTQKRLRAAVMQGLRSYLNSEADDVTIEIDDFYENRDLAVRIPKGVLDSLVTTKERNTNETNRDRRREELIHFYEKHDKSKIAIVDSLLLNDFTELCDAIWNKYADLPEGDVWVENCSAAEEIGEEEDDDSDVYNDNGIEKYKDVFSRRREELIRFYEIHEPTKVSIVDGLLRNEFPDL